MEQTGRQSGFREALSEASNDSSWASRSPPPFYSRFGDVSPRDPADYTTWYEQPSPIQQSPTTLPPSSDNTLEHRASNKETAISSQRTISQGIESVWSGEGDKEVAPFQPPVFPDHDLHNRPQEDKGRGRICGLRWGMVIALIVVFTLLVALGIGLGVGLGVGLRNKGRSNSSSGSSTQSSALATSAYEIGGSLNSAYYSNKGAFNGSGIALASESFDGTTHGDLVMYFQHWTGQIRWQELNDQGQWVGGDITTVVASDAKNSTPLSAVAYAMNNTSTWHVFYVDVNNTLRQKTNTNTSNVWTEGPLTGQNVKVYDADQVGMQACWYGSDYGDSDYAHTPLPSNGDNSNTSVHNYQEVGMHMWYASDNQTFQQLGWRDGDLNWTSQGSWLNKNGHAGVGCYSWGPGTTTYVMMVNLENTVEFWWKDTNTNTTNTTAHPINQWVNSSVAINNVHPSTSLGYTNIFYAQDAATLNIKGYNVTWNSENTTIPAGQSFTVDGSAPGLPGTHLSVTAEPSSSGGNSLYVFYQTIGTDVTEFVRDIVSGQWTESSLPIPN